MTAAERSRRPPRKADPRDDPHDKRKKQSQATILVELCHPVEFFHTPESEPFATYPVDTHNETSPIRSKAFRRWLAREYYQATGAAPSSQSVQDALGVLEGRAAHDGPEIPVFVRVARNDEAVYYDLCNAEWEVVKVRAHGWTIMHEAPVRFRRAKGMAPLPRPAPGGTLRTLRRFLNVSDDQFVLVVSVLLGAAGPGPFAILVLNGEQGSAKTTQTKVIRSIIDPSTAPVRAEPRDVRDVMIAATNSWLVCFDNVSHLPAWLSDCLCRLSTGGGFATRELYSDTDEILFEAKRPVILNGIEDILVRGDALDRAIVQNLPAIPEEQRRTEAEFWAAFERERPFILGALFDAVSCALRNLPTTHLVRLPRMADFATWVVAAEPALPWEPGRFLQVYGGNRNDAHELALEASPVAPVLLTLLDEGDFTGTATQLLDRLGLLAGENATHRRGWPKTPQHLSNILRRLAPNLRAMRVDLVFERDERWNRVIRISRRQEAENTVGSVEGVDSRDLHITPDDGDDAADAVLPSSSFGEHRFGTQAALGLDELSLDLDAEDDPMLRAAINSGFVTSEEAAG